MSTQPPVTWLLSVRNSMPYLPRTLESIAGQTYRNHHLLVWDDCSTDGTLEELHRWIPNRIAGFIYEARSLRLGPSLAFLVNEAETELCARIDGDDISLPERLQKQVEFMTEHPETGVLGTQAMHIDEHGNEGGRWSYPVSDAELRWRSRWHCVFCHPSVMFRRSAVIAAGNYADATCEDRDLWLKLTSFTEFRNLPETLLQYRRSSSSMTGRVEDFIPADRKTSLDNVKLLFPNLSDPQEAMSLWEATNPFHLTARSRTIHAAQLKDAAVLLARQFGKPDNYFTDTETYREQQYHLRRRRLERFGLGPLIKLRQLLASQLHANTIR